MGQVAFQGFHGRRMTAWSSCPPSLAYRRRDRGRSGSRGMQDPNSSAPRRRLRAAAIVVVLAFGVSPAEARTWSCDNHLIAIGDSAARVLARCGEPIFKSLSTEISTVLLATGEEFCGEEAQSRDLYRCPLIGRRERGSTLLTRPHSTAAVAGAAVLGR
ncbi:MAG: DUF2845 domain-containing protein, partial [Chloroflexi bacterium]|nr:DUF2845 domain-containing protein [Chloroflexota bacterium]